MKRVQLNLASASMFGLLFLAACGSGTNNTNGTANQNTDSSSPKATAAAEFPSGAITPGAESNGPLFRIAIKGRNGLINQKGQVVIPTDYEYITQFEGQDVIGAYKNNRWGLIDRTNTERLAFKYELAYTFSDGLLRVYDKDIERYGYVDSQGAIAIEPAYETANSFSEGLAYVYNSEFQGFITPTGEIQIDLTGKGYDYYDVENFHEGLAKVRYYSENLKQEVYGFINSSGAMVIADLDYDFVYDFKNDFAKVGDYQSDNFIDKTGKVLLQNPVRNAQEFAEGLVAAQDKVTDKWGYINTDGNWLIAPQYQEVSSFQDGLASVKQNDLSGLIKSDGSVFIAPAYGYIGKFSEGLAIIEQDNRFGYINAAGEIVIAPEFQWAGDFVNGYAPVRDFYDLSGYIDEAGQFFIEPSYDDAYAFENGLAQVWDEADHFGYVNLQGVLIWPLTK